jgi:hypothetical protein
VAVQRVESEPAFAYVTAVFTQDYVPGVIVLAHSLRKVGSHWAPLVVLHYTHDVEIQQRLLRLQRSFPMVRPVAVAPLPFRSSTIDRRYTRGMWAARQWLAEGHDVWRRVGGLARGVAVVVVCRPGAWVKLYLWALTEYDRVVYMDADAMVLLNMDSLFLHPLLPTAPSALTSVMLQEGGGGFLAGASVRASVTPSCER